MLDSLFFLLVVMASCYFSPSLGQSEGDIRLVSSHDSYFGRLDIFLNGRWGTFCFSTDYGAMAYAACRQLGFYNYRAAYSFNDPLRRYQTTSDALVPRASDTMPIALGSPQCESSHFLHVLRCSYSEASPSCTHDNDLILECDETSLWFSEQYTYNTQIRIQSNTFPSTGTLQIHISGKWGNVCFDRFDQGAADSACRQLGYTNANSFTSTKAHIASRDWLSGIHCGSNSYSCLNRCFNQSTFPATTCPNSDHVSLQCTFDVSRSSTMSSGSSIDCSLNYVLPPTQPPTKTTPDTFPPDPFGTFPDPSDPNTQLCTFDCNDSTDLVFLVYLVFAVPVILFAVIFGIIACIIWKRRKRGGQYRRPFCDSCCGGRCCNRRRPTYNIIHHPGFHH